MLILLVAVVSSTFLAWRWLRSPYRNWNMPGPSAWPLFGNMFNMIFPRKLFMGEHHMRQLLAWSIQYGPIFRVYALIQPMVVLTNVEDFHHVLRDNKLFHTSLIQRVVDRVHPGSLFVADGEEWKKRHRFASAILTEELRARSVSESVRLAKKVVGQWQVMLEQGRQPDADNASRRLFCDINCSVFAGFDGGVVEPLDAPSELLTAFAETPQILMSSFAFGFEYWKYLPLWMVPSHRRLLQLKHTIYSAIADSARHAAAVDADATPRTDVLARGLAAPELVPDGVDLVVEIVGFLFAGEDSSASLFTHVLYLLAQHRPILRAVQRELDAVVGAADPSEESLARCKYLRQVGPSSACVA
jgi:cytochrome P450